MEYQAPRSPLAMNHAGGHTQYWYQRKRVQLLLLSGLCTLLVIILAGPRPTQQPDASGDFPGQAAGAADGGQQQQGGLKGGEQLAPGGAAAAAADGGGKVSVGFYGESLCPDCQHMVRDILSPLFDNGVAPLMHLTYHAFGNVKNGSDGAFVYQHGPNEGKYNRFILCAQHLHPPQAEWFPYVRCMADHMRELDGKADECSTTLGWEAAEISGCAEGDKGKELEQVAAQATWALRPRHSFVPWMTVNGVAIGSDFERLERYVCAAAPASGRPQACYVLSPALANQRGLSG